MAIKLRANDNQDKYNELRKIFIDHIGKISDFYKFEKTLALQALVISASSFIQNSPTVFDNVTTSDLVQCLIIASNIKNLLPDKNSKEAQEFIAKFSLAADLATELMQATIKKDDTSLREFFQTALLQANSQIEELKNQLNTLSGNLNEYQKSYTDKISEVDSAKTAATNEILTLLDNFRSAAAEKGQDLVVIDYRAGAEQERKQSELFRNYTAAFMLLSVSVLIISLFNSGTNGLFSAETITKFFISIILGIPAAYFARESARHRQQQYLYQQYSFNLNALGPFLADFEKNRKDELKSEVARKLFTADHGNTLKEDSYPVNTQEIIMTLLNKIDLPPLYKNNRSTRAQD